MYKFIMQSIRVKIILLLFIGIAIISTLFSIYQYNEQEEHLTYMLENSADRKIKRLSKNLLIPLWEIDSGWVLDIVDTEMMDRELYAVMITGDANLNINKKRNNGWESITFDEDIKGKYIKRTSSIVRDNEEIGKVSIYVTSKFLDEELHKKALEYSFINLFVIIFLIVFLYVILNRIILQPIHNILKTVKAVTDGDYSQKVHLTQYDELGKLSDGFNNMMQSVQDKEDMVIAQSRHAAMGEMISMIAHQWRQPITAIAMGANNILLDIELDDLKPEPAKAGALTIIEQTKHLSKTIDDFKNFFRPNKKVEQVLVNDILEENFKIIGKSLENNNIAIKKVYTSEVQTALYSRELLQVLINIVKNAKEALLEHKVQDAMITVTTKDDNKNIYISICNNGVSIDLKIIKKIFDPYFSTKSEKSGTGLGLYMSKTIIEKHLHGTIEAKNIESGGVCFNMKIPINGVNDE